MLLKLAITGIKQRFRDYVVLLMGLIISSGIFYIFASLAINTDFIKANSGISIAAQVFMFGMVLLLIITMVYVSYANTFLLSMRQHDYGLFMMLGAKKQNIGVLMVLETILLGGVASIIGIILGIGVSSVLSQFLFNQLGVTIHHFSPIYGPAMIDTLTVYVVLFALAAVLNLSKLMRTPVLKLLHVEDEATNVRVRPVLQALAAVLGIACLAIGYYAMAQIMTLQLTAIPIALVTITLGTYLLFSAIIGGVLTAIRKSRFAAKRLRTFTLAQINFRVRGYTRILTVVSLLFAMALGAISVGAGFQRQIPTMVASISSYTISIKDETPNEAKLAKQLHVKWQKSYQQTIQGDTAYYNEAAFAKQPFPMLANPAAKNDGRVKQFSLPEFKKKAIISSDFLALSPTSNHIRFLNNSDFNNLKGQKHQLTIIRVHSNVQDRKVLEKITASQQRRFHEPFFNLGGGYSGFVLFNNLFGGLEFMGFFLGIAFLAMLASCLMFKILSGANKDVVRYNMLNRIGVSQRLMKQAIWQEVGTLFIIPGVLGIIDVLFGLQMFKPLLYNPYEIVGWTILGFCMLYGLYAWLTISLYRRLVVPPMQLSK
ncbi:FtsX-like permease family protein [Furfurilactobacillus siliginis]|uniref:ABC transporter permease n=1 Tax=Furfurilactobacillus siliginis TaxID=348151 RepID=A0A0R2LAH6_9LACO|nr:FtsX-like permease family protein [Furfurilactobacillus siliginis]KRN95460.1 hypothetical protein IV55_GL001920 [Furfurilactobacillus siliginis]GEK28233.1 ABC transporter permease [Furfurilactobacillus siliginis]